ncbi:MAG: beta propeller repeat protein [Acidimicrobiales bacterium]
MSRPVQRSQHDHVVPRSSAISARSLWLFSGGPPRSGSQAKVVERSYDGGKTWRLVASNLPGEHVPPNDIPMTGMLADSGTTGLLAVASPLSAWVVLSGQYVAYRTGDGGPSWLQAAPLEVQSPQQISVSQASTLVLTRTALWASRHGHWLLVAGASSHH